MSQKQIVRTRLKFVSYLPVSAHNSFQFQVVHRCATTAQDDGPIVPSASGPNRHGTLAPRFNGPKLSGPSSRNLCTKGPRDRGVGIPGRNQGSEGLSGAACELPCRLRYLCVA
jgi:hypothetical protein